MSLSSDALHCFLLTGWCADNLFQYLSVHRLPGFLLGPADQVSAEDVCHGLVFRVGVDICGLCNTCPSSVALYKPGLICSTHGACFRVQDLS